MVNNSNKIIVKVGDSSLVKFSNAKVYRAITCRDLELLSNKESDCHIIVIENISADEQDAIKKFIKELESKEGHNYVLFFIPDNDDITSGIADELDYNIYLTLGDLYKAIYEKSGINVSTFLDDKKALNQAELVESIPEGMIDVFGGLTAEEVADISSTIQEIESTEENKEEATQNSSEQLDSTKYSDTEEVSQDTEVIEYTGEVSADTSEYIEKLKMELRDAKYEYSVVFNDMVKASSKIESLEEIIKVLKEEKEDILARYSELVETSDVLEDPISLSEYSSLKDNIKKLEDKINELNSSLEKSKATIEDKDKVLEEKAKEYVELEQELKEKESTISNLQAQINSGELQKEAITEYEAKLAEVEKDCNILRERLSTIETEFINASDKLAAEKDRTTQEAEVRVAITEELQKVVRLFIQLKLELQPYIDKNKELEDKVATCTAELDEVKARNSAYVEQVSQLETDATTFDKKLEIAVSSAQADKIKMQEQIDDLTTQLGITKQQLTQKENQYNTLVATSGMDESGASALLETNKTLENLSKTLQEQLSTSKKELGIARTNESNALKQLEVYKAQCKTLQSNLQNIASAGGIAINAQSMRPINYKQQSQIITVFGSGSFGITTTAYSLAQKLSTTSKVLIIDFDMVSPMLDSWFSKPPFIKDVPGTITGSNQNTSLGIFIEHGVQVVEQNIGKMATMVTNTKGGGIYYFSGLYYTPDTVKLLSADYDSLFNLLGKHFQYIVIDFGRLGCSEANDSIIKAVSDIAFKNIVVTTSNPFEARNFRNRLNGLNINLNKVAWLVNMCSSTALDESVKRFIAPCKFDLLPRLDSYGKQESFLRGQTTRDRFGLFIDKSVFNR